MDDLQVLFAYALDYLYILVDVFLDKGIENSN